MVAGTWVVGNLIITGVALAGLGVTGLYTTENLGDIVRDANEHGGIIQAVNNPQYEVDGVDVAKVGLGGFGMIMFTRFAFWGLARTIRNAGVVVRGTF